MVTMDLIDMYQGSVIPKLCFMVYSHMAVQITCTRREER